jgi:hypothetical protein
VSTSKSKSRVIDYSDMLMESSIDSNVQYISGSRRISKNRRNNDAILDSMDEIINGNINAIYCEVSLSKKLNKRKQQLMK